MGLYFQGLSLLPPYEGKSILELGAGIGRFTGELAQKASQLVALVFIESAIKKVTAFGLSWMEWKLHIFVGVIGMVSLIFWVYLFMQNESINGHHKNAKFMCADVTSPDLNIAEGSVDLIKLASLCICQMKR